jgi:hypothetical protein
MKRHPIIIVIGMVLTLCSCGFQHRHYTRGYYFSDYTTDATPSRDLIVKPKVNDTHNAHHFAPITVDTLIPTAPSPSVLDTIVDSVRVNKSLLDDWEGDRLIHDQADSTLNQHILLDEKVERQAKTSLVTGYMAILFPVIGIILPYLLNTLIVESFWLGFTSLFLYFLLQLTGFIAIFIAATTGLRATRYLESLGLQQVYPETYENARKGKKMAMIVMAVRIGIVLLSTIGFLLLISRFGN